MNGEVPPWPVVALGGVIGSGKLRQKVVLTVEQVHGLLGLPGDVEIADMWLSPGRLWAPGEPVTLHVEFEGRPVPADWRLPL